GPRRRGTGAGVQRGRAAAGLGQHGRRDRPGLGRGAGAEAVTAARQHRQGPAPEAPRPGLEVSRVGRDARGRGELELARLLSLGPSCYTLRSHRRPRTRKGHALGKDPPMNARDFPLRGTLVLLLAWPSAPAVRGQPAAATARARSGQQATLETL